MRSWSSLVFLLAVVALVSTLDIDEYDDNASIDVQSNHTNDYTDLAAQLNCSKLLSHHKAVKTEENATGSIYKKLPYPFSSSSGNHTDGNRPENQSTEKRTQPDAIPLKSKRSLNLHRKSGHLHDASTAIPAAGNDTSVPENHTVECTPGFDDDGPQYNWYQIIVNNGGAPGHVNATRLSPNETTVAEPCHRPINATSWEDLLYEFELVEFEKVYRLERAFLRFAGTAAEFVDIVGHFVWAPPLSYRRYYLVFYRKDDTGFYVNVRKRRKCVFFRDPLDVECHLVNDFVPCEDPSLFLVPAMSAGLTAALIG